MTRAKTIDQWRDDIESAAYETRVCRLELAVAQATNEDPFALEELRVALRGAQARLAERRRRFAASLTKRAKARRKD